MREILFDDGKIKLEFSQAEYDKSRRQAALDFQNTVKPMFERWRRKFSIRLDRPKRPLKVAV